MSKINKKIAVFIVFLTFVSLWGLFTKSPIYNMPGSTYESVMGLHIQFEDGVTESDVKTILGKYNLPTDKLNYNVDNGAYTYYIKVDKENTRDIKDELKKEANWTDPVIPDFKKGDYYIIPVTEQAIQNKSFLAILEKNNLQVKKFVWCDISFGNDRKKWVSHGFFVGIKRQLEKNENIFNVESMV